LTVANCTFIGNMAIAAGGGIFNCRYNNTKITNCCFTGNIAFRTYEYGGVGGGICNDWGSTIITNCTFSYNSAEYGDGGAINNWANNCILRNSILWGNTAGYDGDAIKNWSSGNKLDVDHCDIQGGEAGIHGSFNWGVGNIDIDPMFVRDPNDGGDGWGDDPATSAIDEGANDDYGDLHLQLGSLCIDTGDPNYVVGAGESDLDGGIRVADGDCDEVARIDMGAYEESSWLYAGDFAGGCDVDLVDFGVLAASWQGDDPVIDIVPYLEGDGVIDIGELMVLAENWLEGGV